jgi:hypothetical protein
MPYLLRKSGSCEPRKLPESLYKSWGKGAFGFFDRTGYVEFLKAIRDPKHPEHEEMLEWVGGEFDPDVFDLSGCEFCELA